jgi:hypothetical protein
MHNFIIIVIMRRRHLQPGPTLPAVTTHDKWLEH